MTPRAAGWTLIGPTDISDGGLRSNSTHPFASPQEATALLLSINGTGGPLHNVTLGRAVTQSGTTITFAGTLRIDGLGVFADPDVLAAVGATPYAEQVAASAASPTAAVGVTIRAASPGTIKSATGTIKNGAVSWVVPLDGSQLDLSTTATDDHGAARIWGVAANVALIALITWCVLATAFVIWVVKARQRRAP